MCDDCTLVQVSDVAPPAVLVAPLPPAGRDTPACAEQAKRFAVAMRDRFALTADSRVIEIGATRGIFLRHLHAIGIPALGVPSASIAQTTPDGDGVPSEVTVFGASTAMEIAVGYGRAALVMAVDVLPKMPDMFDFMAGITCILRPNGVLVLQFPHLLALIQRLQFDAFRHDTYAYLSLAALERVLHSVGLRVFDVERVADQGGSLRVYACHAAAAVSTRLSVRAARQAEAFAAIDKRDFYTGFAARAAAAQAEIRDFLHIRTAAGRRIAAYGATARGTTLLNSCGVTPARIEMVADPDPAKAGHTIPGCRIPIVPVETLLDTRPDDVIILPWPHAAEIAASLVALRQKGTQFWIAVPRMTRV
jgi:hypothetical protein